MGQIQDSLYDKAVKAIKKVINNESGLVSRPEIEGYLYSLITEIEDMIDTLEEEA